MRRRGEVDGRVPKPGQFEPGGDVLLEIRALSKCFAVPGGGRLPVLAGLDLEQARGESVAIVGPSGCGKTTLIRVAAGLLAPDAGSVRHAGQALDGPPPWVGTVFQEYNRSLFPWLTLEKNVQFGLRHLPREERRTRARDVIRRVGLAGFERHYPRELSGGMQQRTALARTLVRKPSLLLLDEPFGSLDALTRMELQEFVATLTAELDVAVLLVTHDIDEALLLGDRVLVMSERPSFFRDEIRVDLPRPRHHRDIREMPQSVELRRHVLGLLDAAVPGPFERRPVGEPIASTTRNPSMPTRGTDT